MEHSSSAATQGYPTSIMGIGDISHLKDAPPGRKIAYGSCDHQFCQLYLPGGAGPHPVVILIHGGGWSTEFDLTQLHSVANALVRQDVAVWNIEYHRLGESLTGDNTDIGWPNTFLDVGRSIDHLRTIANENALDLDRVVVMGHSAGGHLALWAGARHKLEHTSDLFEDDPLPLKGILALSPCTELAFLYHAQAMDNAVERLLGGTPESVPSRYRDASPESHIPLGIPHTIFIGAEDGFEIFGRAYFNRARKANDQEIRLVVAPDSGHFEMINPATSTWLHVNSELFKLIS